MEAFFNFFDGQALAFLGSAIAVAMCCVGSAKGTGMAVSVCHKTQQGDFLDALFNEITWWIIRAGLAVWLCGSMLAVLPPVCGTVGLGMLIVGGLMLVLGGTRKAKGFGKVTSLVGIVYNGVT